MITILTHMRSFDKRLRNIIREGVEEELRKNAAAGAAQLSKIARAAELLQQEIGRLDRPENLDYESWQLLSTVRRDVEGAFSRLKFGALWKIVYRRGTENDVILGRITAPSKDEAQEEAVIRWGDRYPAWAIVAVQEPLKK